MWVWGLVAACLLALLYLLSPILTPFIIAFLAAYLIDPLVITLCKRGLNRTVSSLIAVTIVIAGFLGALVAGIPYLVSETTAFIEKLPQHKQVFEEKALPFLHEKIGPWLDFWPEFKDILSQLPSHSEKIAQISGNVLQNMALSTMAVVDLISILLLVPLIVFYLLKDWPHILKTSQNLLPQNWQKPAQKLITEVDTALASFLRGQLSVCFVLGLFYGISLWFLGLELGLFLGLLTGFLVFIPVVGGLIGNTLIILFALVQYQFTAVEPYLWLAGILAAGSLLENFLLTPYLVGSSVGLHPVWIIFALMAGSQLGGFIGVLIAVPTASIMAVIIPKIVSNWKKSQLYKKAKSK
jgi:predicted PurR-regulated permease PerM